VAALRAALAVFLAGSAAAQGVPVKTSLLGGNGTDRVQGIAVGSSGLVYAVMNTSSTNFGQLLPAAAGGYDTTANASPDAFVAVLSRDLSQVLAWSYLGGTAEDRGYGITVDAQGRPHVVGFTISTDFPTTTGTPNHGGRDVFVARFSADLKQLQMCTLIGGADEENCRDAITIDASGNTYISGLTGSYDFPATLGAFQKSHAPGGVAGNWDAFVAKLSPAGAILWGTYLGGSGEDSAYSGIRIRSDGTIYVAGMTNSANLPTTPNAYQRTFGGWPGVDPFIGDGFVARFAASGSQLLFCTYLGGSGNDMVSGNEALELDSSGNPVVIGLTKSAAFPTTAGAYDLTYSGGGEYDGFVSKLSADGSTLLASTFIGGGLFEEPSGLALDPEDNVYLGGNTTSADYPVTPDALQRLFGGGRDGFVSKLSADLRRLTYSSYLGGSGDGDRGRCLTFNVFNEAIIGGDTDSSNFPTTLQAAMQGYKGGAADGFVSLVRLSDTYAFGSGKRNSLGVEPALTWSGSPSAAVGSFTVRARNLVPGKFGKLVFGTALVDVPYFGGTLYAGSPAKCVAWAQADKSGQVSFAVPVDGALSGTMRVYQFLYRDRLHPDGTATGSTNALKVTFVP